MNEVQINNKEQFSAKIHKIARENGLNIIDAITSYCEDNDFLMEDIIPLLDRNMKEEIRVSAIENRYVRGFKKPATLF